jgi:hypothetical protein
MAADAKSNGKIEALAMSREETFMEFPPWF